jgi:hypothetical protein
MRTGASSTASWRPRAAETAIVAVAGAVALAAAAASLRPDPAQAALVCEPAGTVAVAQQADVIFTGRLTRLFDDQAVAAPWARPFVDHWPPVLPIPQVDDPNAPKTPAALFRVSVVYKGLVDSSELTVRLLGRPGVASGEWTIFANRSDRAHLFTTGCSGNVRGPIDPHAYALPAGHPVTPPWWQALLAPAAVLAALVLGAAAAAGGYWLLRRGRPAAAAVGGDQPR